ncbi:hypothetical protein K8S19_06085 [bacterium]|nr:hypothetical protein [bacterium]
MKKTVSILLFGGMLFLAGCAGVNRRSESLHVTITPEKIYPGCVVVAEVIAPPGTTVMTGRLDYPGSPVIPMRTRDGGKTWDFTTQIPLDAFWQPGRYRVVVEGRGPNGSSLSGQTWVTAP